MTDLAVALTRASGIETRVAASLPPLKVNIFVNRFSVGALQSRIAEVLHLSWRVVNSDAPASGWIYELYRNKLNEAEQHGLLERADRSFRAGIEDAVKAQELTGEDLERFTSGKPVLESVMEEPAQRGAAKILSYLDAGQRERIYRGEEISLSTQGAQESLRRSVDNLTDITRIPANDVGTQRLTGESTKVLFRSVESGADRKIVVDVRGPGGSTAATVFGTTSASTFADLYDERRDTPDYASTHKIVNINGTVSKKNLDTMLEWLAGSVGVNIVAESYRLHNSEIGRSLQAGQQSIESILDTICLGDERWWKRGSCYMLQHKYWFIDRESLVSDDLVKTLKEIMKRKPVALEDYAQIGTLSTSNG